jgi:hypothetical protein
MVQRGGPDRTKLAANAFIIGHDDVREMKQ